MPAIENSPICASICAIRSGVISLVSDNLELTLVDVSFKIAGRMTDRMVDEGAGTTMSGRIATLSRPCFP